MYCVVYFGGLFVCLCCTQLLWQSTLANRTLANETTTPPQLLLSSNRFTLQKHPIYQAGRGLWRHVIMLHYEKSRVQIQNFWSLTHTMDSKSGYLTPCCLHFDHSFLNLSHANPLTLINSMPLWEEVFNDYTKDWYYHCPFNDNVWLYSTVLLICFLHSPFSEFKQM